MAVEKDVRWTGAQRLPKGRVEFAWDTVGVNNANWRDAVEELPEQVNFVCYMVVERYARLMDARTALEGTVRFVLSIWAVDNVALKDVCRILQKGPVVIVRHMVV
mmetsp:Transcript_9453/g.12826  ORF Transcript_9453/g.12826 Transcript_9453/m.12826 type:complete len:105 (+) Transcript_9453:779-1093(+)